VQGTNNADGGAALDQCGPLLAHCFR
jgi:hypothetical protein